MKLINMLIQDKALTQNYLKTFWIMHHLRDSIVQTRIGSAYVGAECFIPPNV